MSNKKILSKLIKIASNQQIILNKIAQVSGNPEGEANSATDAAMNDFVKYQFTSWAMPREIAARLSFSADRDLNSKNYNVDVVLSLSDPKQKSLVEDPTNGFAAWLTAKFATAPTVEKWKSLAGCTASFNVTTK